MKIIIDRFEGDYAIVEMPNEDFLNIPIKLVAGAKEGDVISVEIDKEETAIRKKKIGELMESLWEG